MPDIKIIIKEEEEYFMDNHDLVKKDRNGWPIGTTLCIKKEEGTCCKTIQGSEDFESISNPTDIAYSIKEKQTHFADHHHLEKRRRLSRHIGDPVIRSMFSVNGRHEENIGFLAESWPKKRHTGVNMADRKRKAKFTGRELEVLVDAIIPNESQLFGVRSHRTPISVKNKIWSKILAQVNSVAAVRRNKEDCKKKWYDLKRRIKDKIVQAKEHSKGACAVPAIGLEFSSIQEKVLATMDIGTIEGTDGVDTTAETRDEQQSDADFLEDEGTEEQNAVAETDTNVFDEATLECPTAPRNDLDPLLDTEMQLLTMTQRQCDLMESLNHRISKHSAMTRRSNAALCLEVRRLSTAVGAMAAAVEKHSMKTEALHNTLLEACRSNAQAIGGIIEIIGSNKQCE